MSDSAHTGPFRSDIQGLRAIAIALVVLAHATVPGFAGGFVGVDVFFVLSGYLITGLLVRERLSTGRIRYVKFLTRRLRRLLPAMIAMLVSTLLLSIALLSDYETRMLTGSFVSAATWTSNFFFAFSNFDYFAALQTKDLYLHTWSLGVEEQFYLVWPWLVVLAFSFLGNGGATGQRKKLVLYLLAGVFATSLALCLHWAEYGPLLGFYMMPARGWQFALGAAVFVWFHNFQASHVSPEKYTNQTRMKSVIGAAGMLLIIASAVLLDTDLAYPGYLALFPSVGTALVIVGGQVASSTALNRVLASRYFVWLGDRSYSLYLWHWPVLVLGDAFGVIRSTAGVAVLLAISILLASLCYRFIEVPFWKGRFSYVVPASTVLASVAVVTIAVGAEYTLQVTIYGEPQVTALNADYNPRRDLPAIYDSGLERDTYYDSAELVPCVEGSEDAKYTALLFGDSIGAQWASSLGEVYAAPDWKVAVLTKSACAIVDEEYYYAPVGGMYDVCADWRDAAIAYLAETRPDVVFIGSSSQYEFSGEQWTNGVVRVLERISSASKQVVIIPGTPGLSFDGPTCIESPYRFSFQLADSLRECEEGLSSTTSEEVASYLERAASRFANVRVLNLNDLVCPEQRYAAQTTDGLTVFRDRRHLTDTFVRAQATVILGQLDHLQVGPTFPEVTAALASGK